MRPLHQWKTFWLGLIILTFLCWAWQRGRSHDDYISAHLGKDTWHCLVSSRGYLSWFIESFPPGSRYSRNIDYDSAATGLEIPWFPPPLTREYNTTIYVSRTIYSISHWFTALLFFLTWSTLLLWRVRRIRRLTTHTSPP